MSKSAIFNARLGMQGDQWKVIVDLWRRLLDAHLTETCEDDGGWTSHIVKIPNARLAEHIAADGEPSGYCPIVIYLAAYSDYGGSDLDAANVRALADYPGVETHTDGFDGEGYARITLGELPTNDGDIEDGIGWLRWLVEMMERLDDYPLLDESAHSEYQQELVDEAWEAWLESDIMSDLDQMLEDATGDDGMNEPDLRAGRADEVRQAYYECEGNDWSCETATSVVNLRHDDALQHVARTLFNLDPFWVVEVRAQGESHWSLVAETGTKDAARFTVQRAREADEDYREYRTRMTARKAREDKGTRS